MLRPRERRALTTQRLLHGFSQGCAAPGLEHRFQAKLGSFREATLAMGDRTQLTSETELAEACQWLPLGRAQGSTLARAGNGQRDRKIGSGLIDPHPADDVDEDI